MRKFAIALMAMGFIVASCASKEETETVPEPAPIAAPDTAVTEPDTTTHAEEPKAEATKTTTTKTTKSTKKKSSKTK